MTITSLSDALSTSFEIDDSHRYEVENAAKVFIRKKSEQVQNGLKLLHQKEHTKLTSKLHFQ